MTEFRLIPNNDNTPGMPVSPVACHWNADQGSLRFSRSPGFGYADHPAYWEKLLH